MLVQKYALEQAQAQLAQLRRQSQELQQQPAHSTSFLGSLLGHRDPAPPAAPPPPPPGTTATRRLRGIALCPALESTACLWPPSSGPGWRRSFLRTAATTAAGVAAGALAFQGIESLTAWLWSFAAGLGGGGFLGGEGRPEETVINNYYDDPGQ